MYWGYEYFRAKTVDLQATALPGAAYSDLTLEYCVRARAKSTW